MARLLIQLDIDGFTLQDLTDRYTRTDRYSNIARLHELLGSIGPGRRRAQVYTYVSGAQPSQTVDMDQAAAVDGTDDITIDGTTLSVEAAPSDENEFLQGADDIEFAANLAAAINAHSVLSLSYRAVSDGVDEVTISHILGGTAGNGKALAETGNGFTLGGATLAGGAQAATQEFNFGQS